MRKASEVLWRTTLRCVEVLEHTADDVPQGAAFWCEQSFMQFNFQQHFNQITQLI